MASIAAITPARAMGVSGAPCAGWRGVEEGEGGGEGDDLVPGLGFWGWIFVISVSGFRFQNSGFRVSSSRFRIPGCGMQVSGSGIRVSQFRFRDQSFGLAVGGPMKVRMAASSFARNLC